MGFFFLCDGSFMEAKQRGAVFVWLSFFASVSLVFFS